MRHASRFLAVTAVLALSIPTAFADTRLQITPSTFDFGWAPDNAKITAEFTIMNTGEDMVPLTAVKPTCGCTVTDFEPDALASHEQKKVALTFNTRGYTGQAFNKMAKVKTDLADDAYTVYMVGSVLKADSGLVPDSGGIAGFDKNSGNKKKITLTNRSEGEMSLVIIQPPAAWAKVKFSPKPVKAGDKAEIEITVDGSLEEARATSLTVAPSENPAENRVTLAIRTGPPPPAYRPYVPPPPPTAPVTTQPAKPATKPAGKPASKPAK